MVSQAEKPTTAKLLVTGPQAAEMLSISHRTLDRMAADGTFTRIKIGGGKGVRFSVAELQAFIDKQLATAKSQDSCLEGLNDELSKLLGGAS